MGLPDDRIRENLAQIENRISNACARADRDTGSVRLIAVTKTCPAATAQILINLGIRDIGENRVQEIVEKAPQLTGDHTLHLIGHLQTNKVAHVLPFVTWIHSIDREKLVSRIERCHTGAGRISALVEVNTSGEASKSGCMPDQCRALCERVASSTALEFRGLMTVGPLEGGEKATRASFELLRQLGDSCQDLAPRMELSMGMSGDFEWAIEEGSTMVRIGTALAGKRTL
ncbi:MAG: YggS family pyridoxal phosphate-dependent enzyme [Chitinispirillaceae bacterium]|nr:YggS family pyridoxal phosphate-dependent enzyme [Chitinispirillaceae bacterium]